MKNIICPYLLFLDDNNVFAIRVPDSKEKAIFIPPKNESLPKHIENFYVDSINLINKTGTFLVKERKSKVWLILLFFLLLWLLLWFISLLIL